MAPKRRSPPSHHSSSGSASPEPTRTRSCPADKPPPLSPKTIKVHIIQAKLDAKAVSKLFSVLDDQRQQAPRVFELCMNPAIADVIVTAIRMRQRLERHLAWDLAVRVYIK